MPRIILLATIAVILFLWWRGLAGRKSHERKLYILWSLVGLLLAILALLTVTGRLHWLVAVVGAVVALIPRLLSLLRFLPLFSRLAQGFQSRQQSATRGKMGQAEALAVLGLQPGVSQEEIIQTHRRLMQKIHPDRGGSDHMAAQLNTARDVLLS